MTASPTPCVRFFRRADGTVIKLKVGEQVVTSGQFLIDSESSLQASFLRMAESEDTAAPSAR